MIDLPVGFSQKLKKIKEKNGEILDESRVYQRGPS